ncbi:TetR family transcriptional regulator [Massilia sp. JS1662]|nr:TetR/AcrR family transcriptional regulator [Massilia sp. JS1662]KGF81397.1 TetR family transcriptional regulator [Massilia sp. JS1662]
MDEEKERIPLRERVFRAASGLFYREGIRGVGVDAIAKAAGTTKMGLYRQFESKDVLITEWVAQQVAQYRAVLDELARRWPDEPRRQLIGFAQFIADDIERSSHRGCAFINTIAELPDDSHAARRLIEEHKARQLERLTALCRACGLSRPDRAAIHLTLILEGAQAVAQNRSVPQLRKHLMELTEDVLAAG